MVLIGANRQQLVNTRVPWGTPLPVSNPNPDLLRIARETQEPYVTDLSQGIIAKKRIFSVSVPVRKGEEIPYALAMSLEPDRLVEILTGESLPSGWLAAVSDRHNLNMARTQLANEFLGRPIPEELVRQYAGRAEGVIETTDFEGQRSLQAFHWSRLTGWRVATWAPLSLVEGQLRQAWTLFFWSGRGAAVALAPDRFRRRPADGRTDGRSSCMPVSRSARASPCPRSPRRCGRPTSFPACSAPRPRSST